MATTASVVSEGQTSAPKSSTASAVSEGQTSAPTSSTSASGYTPSPRSASYTATPVAAYTDDEMNSKYGNVISNTTGGLKYNSATGYYAYSPGATTRLPGTGEVGWVEVTGPSRNDTSADATFLSDGSYAAVQVEKQKFSDAQARYNEAVAKGNTAAADAAYADMLQAHDNAERIRARAGYSGGQDGSQYYVYPSSSGSGSGSGDATLYYPGGSGSGSGSSASSSASGYGTPGNAQLDITGAYRTDSSQYQAMLDAWRDAAIQQNNAKIDYAVNQAVDQLQRALEDAQPQFREQAESVSREERQGMDNSALYAELRGDRGGIGQSQYNEIQAQAAQNRLAVQQAQTKLATDTARQIEDLRAQGEFDKADAALQVSQSYMQQLVSIEQWATEYNLSADQFEASLQEWEYEYNLAMAQFQTSTRLQEEQLAWNKEQYYDTKNYQMYRDSISDARYNDETAYSRSRDTINDERYADELAYSRSRDTINDERYADELAYSRYRDTVSDDRYNDETAYSRSRDTINDQRYNDETAYSRNRDDIADQRYKEETDYSHSRDAIEDERYADETAYDRKLDLAQTGWNLLSAGVIPDDTTLSAMGISKEKAQEYVWAAQMAASASGSSRGSSGSYGSSGGSSSSSSSGSGDMMTDAAAWASANNADPEVYIANNYKSYGYKSATAATNAWAQYKAENPGWKGVSQDKFTNISRSLNEQLVNGRKSNALGYLDSVWDSLSPSQKSQVQHILNAYGISEYTP